MYTEFQNFVYNEKHQFVFAYVPKVACSNWKCVLRYLEGHENYLDTKLAHDRAKSGLRYLVDEEDPWAIVNNPRIRKLSFVRDPYSRCLSAYLNKIEFNLSKIAEGIERDDIFYFITTEIEKFRNTSLEPSEFSEVTFDVFLKWLLDGPEWLTRNEHWYPQSSLLLADEIEYDFIGRFEDISNDATRVLEIMNCDIRFPSQKDINFAPTKANEQLEEYYTEATKTLAQQVYKQDFTHFGYDANVQFYSK
jgi:hypothetical protein